MVDTTCLPVIISLSFTNLFWKDRLYLYIGLISSKNIRKGEHWGKACSRREVAKLEELFYSKTIISEVLTNITHHTVSRINRYKNGSIRMTYQILVDSLESMPICL